MFSWDTTASSYVDTISFLGEKLPGQPISMTLDSNTINLHKPPSEKKSCPCWKHMYSMTVTRRQEEESLLINSMLMESTPWSQLFSMLYVYYSMSVPELVCVQLSMNGLICTLFTASSFTSNYFLFISPLFFTDVILNSECSLKLLVIYSKTDLLDCRPHMYM